MRLKPIPFLFHPIVDTEKPIIQNCPTVINVNTPLGTALTPVNWPSLQVSDNSGQTSVQSQSASSGDSFPPGRTTVTIIYQDPSSNTDTCQFSVIVTEGNYRIQIQSRMVQSYNPLLGMPVFRPSDLFSGHSSGLFVYKMALSR